MPSKDVVVNIIGVDKGTSAMLKKVQADADAAGTGLGNSIDKGSTKAGQALSKFGNSAAGYLGPAGLAIAAIGDRLTTVATKGQTLQGVITEIGKASLIGGVAGIAAFGGAAVKLGSALDDAQASLKASVTAAHQSLQAYQPQIDSTEQSMEKFGFTNTQVQAALAKSVISTGDVGKSLGIMGLAADLAAAKHTDLATATDALDRAMVGNLRPLTAMGISLPIVATNALKLKTANDAVTTAQENVNAILAKVPDAANAASAAHGIYETAVNHLATAQGKLHDQSAASGEIIDALTQKLGGQASAAADTLSGKTAALSAEWKDVTARIGQDVIPKLEDLVGWMAQNEGKVKDVAEAIGVVLAAAIVDFAVVKVGTFLTGIAKIVAGIESIATKMIATALSIGEQDAAILASNRAVAESFVAWLGPIGDVAIAAAAMYAVLKPVKVGAGDITAGQMASEFTSEQKTGSGPANAAGRIAQLAQFNKTLMDEQSQYRLNSSGKVYALPGSAAALMAKAKDVGKPPPGGGAGGDSPAADAAAAAALAAHTKAVDAATAAHTKLEAAIAKVTTATQGLITNALNKAKTALASAQSAFASFAASTSSSITSNFSFGTVDSDAATNGTSFISQLQAQAAQVGDFTTKVNQLLQDGLSQNALSQVLAAGSTAGDDIATQLLAGGSSAIDQANSLTASVQNMADSLGTSAADQFYSSGVKQAQSIVDGIVDLSKSKKVANQLKDASAKMAEALKTKVEIDLSIIAKGGKVPKMASGGIVTSPTYALIGEAGPEAVIPLGSASTGIGASGSMVFTGDISVSVATGSPQEIVNALRTYIQRNGSLASAGVK